MASIKGDKGESGQTSSDGDSIEEKMRQLPFPYAFTPGDEPAVIFCHGYSSTYQGPLALAIEAFVKAHNRAFVRFEYRYIWEEGRPHDIHTWIEDLDAIIALFQQPPVVVGYSMGSVAAMGAAAAKNHGDSCIRSLVLMCPPLEDDRQRAIDRLDVLRNGFAKKIRDGETILMQERPGGWPNYISLRTLDSIDAHNPLRWPTTRGRRFPVRCPARFINGMADTTALYTTTCRIANDCLESTDVEVLLLRGHGHELAFVPALRNYLQWAIDN